MSLLAILQATKPRIITRYVNNIKHRISEYVFTDGGTKKIGWVRNDIDEVKIDGIENQIFVETVNVSLVQSRSELAKDYDYYWTHDGGK